MQLKARHNESHQGGGGGLRSGSGIGRSLFLTLLLLGVWSSGRGLAQDGTRMPDPDALRLAHMPREIQFLIYVLDISEIDAQSQSVAVNLYVRLRWKDDSLRHSEEEPRTLPVSQVWNPSLLLANQHGIVRTSLPEVVSVEADGTVSYRQRYVGSVAEALDLSEFPLDRQRFTVHFVPGAADPEELIFVPDRDAAAAAPGPEEFVGAGMAETLRLPDWEVLSFEGKPHPFRVTDDLEVPGFAFFFTARRHFRYYVWHLIFPQILIVVMSWAVFWIDPSLAATKISLSMASMLTLVAHRFVVASQLPRLSYMTRMDLFVTLSTVLVFAAFVESVSTAALSHAGRNEISVRTDSLSRLVFPCLFAGVLVFSFMV